MTPVFGEGFNGPSTYVRYLWDAFRSDAEIDFHVVATSFPEEHQNFHLAQTLRSGSLGLYQALNLKVLELLEKFGPEAIVHCNVAFPHAPLIGKCQRLIAQINDDDNTDIYSRLPYTIRHFGCRRALSLIVRRWGEGRMVRNAALVVCNSNYTRERVRRSYGVRQSDRILTIHKAVDVDYFDASKHLTSPEEELRLIYVGSNWKRKGLLDLMAAVSAIVDRGVSLRVIGADREQVISAMPETEALERQGIITFLGELSPDAIRKQLYVSDVLVLPSHAEAFGVALIEAMSAAVAVIGSRVGGIPEIIESESFGILVPPRDVDALMLEILRLRDDMELLTRLRKNGPMRAQKFSTISMIIKLKQQYHKLATTEI